MAPRLRARSRPWGSSRESCYLRTGHRAPLWRRGDDPMRPGLPGSLQQEYLEELPLVADAEAPAASHDVVDVPAKEKDRDQCAEQRKRDPDPHPPLLFGAGYLDRTPFAERRLYPRRGGSMQVEIAEDPVGARA